MTYEKMSFVKLFPKESRSRNSLQINLCLDDCSSKAWRNIDWTCADPEGGGGKNHKTIGFLSNTGPDLLDNHKATKPAFNVESFKWRFAGGSMMACF